MARNIIPAEIQGKHFEEVGRLYYDRENLAILSLISLQEDSYHLIKETLSLKQYKKERGQTLEANTYPYHGRL
jgi:hypothetical protein